MDVDESKARHIRELYGIPRYYTSLDGLLRDGEVEAVVVLTPPQTHPEVVIRAAEAGKHIYCEKPMAPTVQEADLMVDVCRRNNVKTYGRVYEAV